MQWIASGLLLIGAALRLTLAAVLIKTPRGETRTAGLWMFNVEAACLLAIALLLLTGLDILWAVAALLVVIDIMARAYFRHRRVHVESGG